MQARATGFSVLDNEDYMSKCLDSFSDAKKNGLEVRCIFCEKCKKPFLDEQFTQILSNKRKCSYCQHSQVVGSDLVCNPLAWFTQPVVENVTINATNIVKIDNVLKNIFQAKYAEIKR